MGVTKSARESEKQSRRCLITQHKDREIKEKIQITEDSQRAGLTLIFTDCPLGWPIVGNLFQVAFSGKQFFQYIRHLQPLYGPIFTLKMGSRTLKIVARAQLAHQALIQNGETFANRPAEHPTRSIFSCNKFTVNSALYGATWPSLPRNMVQNMLCPGRIKEFFELRNSGMDRLIDRIRLESRVQYS
ncbi:hypothetical protein Scep_003250 [Stephania cephalantha]|uniref:Uncharacterized protein n=1 Tax=Stephania cephalantha TaxID=152367 RepID=A0AAP0KQA4_9MAGN